MIHTYHRILLTNKKEETVDAYNKLGKSENHNECEKPIPKVSILYVIA